MEITKENSKLILDKFAKVLNAFFPGIVAFEVFFNVGFFSNVPDSIFKFLLYIFWCIIFSIPFTFFNHDILESFMKHSFKIFGEVNGSIKEEIAERYNSLTKEEKEEFSNWNEEIYFGVILMKTILLYILFKVFNFYQLLNYKIFEIPSLYLKIFVILFSVQFIAYPLGYLFAKINLHRLKIHFKKDDF